MSIPVRVVKMSGAGNDFVVLGPDEARRMGEAIVSWTRRVCRRGLSVGADGVLVVEPSGPGRARVRFLNPDGSDAFCGNGSRCAARFALLRGFAGPLMTLDTAAGDVPAEVDGDRVRLTLPAPEDRGSETIETAGVRIEGRRILAGVPHFVISVPDLAAAPLHVWGPRLRSNPRFGPAGTNVDLVRRREDGAVAIRTWERGVEGETLACGSGALAAARALGLDGRADRRIFILPRSGVPLVVELGATPGVSPVVLEGDARLVFEGVVTPEGVEGFPTC